MDFKDKIVIVTGAAGGIGAGTVKAFVEQGAKVVLVDISKENLEKTAVNLKLQEGRFLLIPTDVSKEDDVINYVRKTKEVFGRIDVFFNSYHYKISYIAHFIRFSIGGYIFVGQKRCYSE